MAMKHTDILNRYRIGQIYIFENIVAKNTIVYMFIQNIDQGTILENLNA